MKIVLGLFLVFLFFSSYVNNTFSISAEKNDDAVGDIQAKKYLGLLYKCIDSSSDISICMIKFENQLLRNQILEDYAELAGGFRESVSKDPLLNYPTKFLKMYTDPQKSLNYYQSYVMTKMRSIETMKDAVSLMMIDQLKADYQFECTVPGEVHFIKEIKVICQKKTDYASEYHGSKLLIDTGIIDYKKLRQTAERSQLLRFVPQPNAFPANSATPTIIQSQHAQSTVDNGQNVQKKLPNPYLQSKVYKSPSIDYQQYGKDMYYWQKNRIGAPPMINDYRK